MGERVNSIKIKSTSGFIQDTIVETDKGELLPVNYISWQLDCNGKEANWAVCKLGIDIVPFEAEVSLDSLECVVRDGTVEEYLLKLLRLLPEEKREIIFKELKKNA